MRLDLKDRGELIFFRNFTLQRKQVPFPKSCAILYTLGNPRQSTPSSR